MLDTKDFSFFETQNTFDFKGFLIKIGSYWRWFIICLAVSFTIAYQVNIRKQKIYEMSNVISLKEENNPFFTANTSLVFNWGGTSDQVNNIITKLKSRTHNELVVDKMQYYVEYYKQGKYFEIDAYGEAPFVVEIDRNQNQLISRNIKLKLINSTDYQISIDFEQNEVTTFNYILNKSKSTKAAKGTYKQKFKIGQQVSLPFLSWKLILKQIPENYSDQEYNIRLNDFDGTVSRFQGIKIASDDKSGSIITLTLQGTNKARMVDYLNTTIDVLIKNELDKKNLFATNTIKFIDSTLIETEKQIKAVNNDLNVFQKGKNIFEIKEGGGIYSSELNKLDESRDVINRKITYLNTLKTYLRNNDDFSKLPAPSVAGIDDPNIVANVSKLISLSVARSQMAYSVKNEKIFNDFDNEMASIKNVLLENINSVRNETNYDQNLINSKIIQAEKELYKLPEDKQELTKIERKYSLNDNIYENFLAKKNEAQVVKAANLSDIHFIDSAKDIGGGLIGPRTGVNYITAFFAGILIPLFIIFLLFFINNSVQNVDDISRLTNIPLIGVIGKKNMKSNLAVYEKPKSALSESFRAIRSSLQFIYKKNNVSGTKTLMLTSTVSGEGKTFCSINIATVFALSEKKTVVIGLDLRKPKIFDDFNVKNDIGAVNYLIGQKTLDQVIQKTQIPFLDVITSGPIPPNPSELIMGESMSEMMAALKSKYDYIILDTPPVGLVADALELAQFCDATLYVIRQNYTKKDMITLLNNREKRGELNNISIILNGFENKAKYGYAYGYGFDYGYGSYSNGYHEDDKPKNIFSKYSKIIFKK
ncbi:MAG: polysaccharide biosynthesis tyrosine autokinase [Flavobacterium sp.]|nr:polysaccharide biosynthesis tyrosine autokinase [Flavobacterium sp.]